MYQTSDDYKSKIYLPSTRHLLKIFINNVEIDKKYILGFKPSHRLFNNDEFTFGSVTSKALDLKLYKTAVPDSIESIYVVSGIEGEEVPIGYFNVEERTSEDDYTITLKLLDNMIKFEVNYDGSTLEYPCNLMTVLTDICNKVGVELGSTSFLNADKEVAVYDNTVSARTYISYIAEQAGGFAFIGRDGKLYIKTIGENISELPIQYFQDFKWGEQFKVSRVRYEDGVQLFEAGDETNNTIYINQENMYIVDQEQIDNIHDRYKDFNCYSFEGNSIIDPALDIGDLLLIDGKYVIYQGDMDYVGKFKANISSKIQAKTKEETMVRTPSQKTINRRVESRINQVEGSITEVISKTEDQNQKISQVTKKVDELNSKIQDIADITTFGESMYAKVELDKINESEPIQIIVKPTVENISYLYPHENLYPSEDLYLKDRKIRFTNKTDNTYIDYILPDDLLIAPDGTYDEFYLGYDEQVCQITHRCQYNADGTVSKLEQEQITSYEYPKIELKDGDYTMELLGYANAYLSVRMMAQNIYTTQFYTKAEVDSEISQKADEISAEVSKKLDEDEFSTKLKMDYESVQIAWNKIDELIQFIEGKLKILNQNKQLLMALDKTGQHFYDSSGDKIGDIGITTFEDAPVIAFNLNVDENHNKGMAWGIEKDGVFYPIFYTIGTYYDEGGEYGGAFVVAGDLEVGDTLKGVMAELTMLKSYTIYADTITGLNNTPPMIRNYYNSSQYYDGYPMTGINTDRTYQCYGDGDNLWFYVDGDLITSFSDKRLKTDIKEIDETLINIIGELKIYQFKFLKNQNKTTIGIMAQDLVEIANKYNVDIEEYSIINKVKKNIDSEELYYSINYEQFLILRQLYNEKKIQEQQELIEQLQNEIKELKGEK